MTMETADRRHFDVLIVGAGISGIGAAHHLKKRCPSKTFAILEARNAIGGTWDLFRYPGIRSDSDMFTLGYGFRPWSNAKIIADGPSIRAYVDETAREYGIDEQIRFDHRVESYAWDGDAALWTATVQTPDGVRLFTCNMVLNCAGYYRYSAGYTPEFPGADCFKGDIIHPQNWPEGYDYKAKRVVIIGSGATAVTLAPAMANDAAGVVMLQRSPSYVYALPGDSQLAKALGKVLPWRLAFHLMRWQRILFQQFAFKLIRAFPEAAKRNLIKTVDAALGDTPDVRKHFTPSYSPWDQRICIIPDGDLFSSIKSGAVSIVTDHIECFEPGGVRLKSGGLLEADLIITATGLALENAGGASISIDGAPFISGEALTYKGLMFEGLPNFVSAFGYINASWTLRADLVCAFACRLIEFLDREGYDAATPVNKDPTMPREPFLNFSSGYVARAKDILPKQGRAPWRHPQDYFVDLMRLRFGRINDGALMFARARKTASARPPLNSVAAE